MSNPNGRTIEATLERIAALERELVDARRALVAMVDAGSAATAEALLLVNDQIWADEPADEMWIGAPPRPCVCAASGDAACGTRWTLPLPAHYCTRAHGHDGDHVACGRERHDKWRWDEY